MSGRALPSGFGVDPYVTSTAAAALRVGPLPTTDADRARWIAARSVEIADASEKLVHAIQALGPVPAAQALAMAVCSLATATGEAVQAVRDLHGNGEALDQAIALARACLRHAARAREASGLTLDNHGGAR